MSPIIRLSAHTLLSLTPVLILAGCKGQVWHPSKTPIVVMDEWWNVDYAKNRCEQRAKLNPCIGDSASEVRDFELKVASAFTADATCHGFKLVGVLGPVKTDDVIASQWQLMFNYDPGEAKQSWTLVAKSGVSSVTTGEDGPKETVRAICSVLGQKGGSVE